MRVVTSSQQRVYQEWLTSFTCIHFLDCKQLESMAFFANSCLENLWFSSDAKLVFVGLNSIQFAHDTCLIQF